MNGLSALALRALFGFLSALAIAFSAPASAASSNIVKTEHVTAELVAEHASVAPGRTVAIALRLKHIPHWHTYWRNPGDSGLPTTIRWKLPVTVSAGEIQWPTPQRLPIGPLMNFGYEGEVWLVSEIAVPANYAGSSITIDARADWLVCAEICIPETGNFKLTLPVVAPGTSPSLNKGAIEGFSRTRASYPLRSANWGLSARIIANGAALHITPSSGVGALRKAYFFPSNEGQIEPSGRQTFQRVGSDYILELPRSTQATFPLERLQGVLVVDVDTAGKAIELDVPIAGVSAASNPRANASTLTLITAVLFAFLGGIILNAMPCVFPILSIKVLGFAHETDPRRARRHGVFYAIGVVLSFWLLAALLLGLRAAGDQIGWGFQLQSPVVVVALAALFFLLALNLFGLFEIGHVLPSAMSSARSKRPDHDALLSGVLAVAVASPCTGPFMGAALGYAVTQSGMASFLVFTALGFGMALPYVLLAWFPRARRMLPKPGAWMERLRQFLAFPLLATVVWLAWVLGVQLGIDAVAYLLTALLLVALSIWLLRVSGASHRKRLARSGAALAAAAAIAMVTWIVSLPVGAAATPADSAAWAPYSAQAVAALNAEGKTVFVDFTAAWCLTCQVNKKLVLNTDEIQNAFVTRGIAALRADWTRRDPEITRALDSLGRSGLPVYLVQRPGRAPRLLPELLTKEIVLRALDDRND